MPEIDLDSDLLEYIVREGFAPGDRLPTINELQADDYLGVSISKVREQLEVARALGLVEVKSKTGMKMRSYSFTPAVRLSLFFALAQDQRNFELFGELRNHLEVAFWNEACALLQDEDKRLMRECLDRADAKLNGKPVRIPTEEHRTFHLTVFKRLDNPFVMGILEAYWDAYDAVELNRYSDYSYLQQVWSYHERIFQAICEGDYERAKALFIDHTNLIRFQPWMQRIHAPPEPGIGNE
ncbi:MAG: FCD domain-containing protein [Anaerolineae bacterium]